MTDEEYTPTTDEVRATYAAYTLQVLGRHPRVREEFDRWLAEHDRQIREQIAEEIEAKYSWMDDGDPFRVTASDAAGIARGGDRS